ncbi:hypothetical protein M8C21_028883 [Ambrosia artemisiifolia]|uniref:peroxidase n=1 Tax=Ambrosia artemisiifolia TaxID=4212 RepID=A0AAD5GDR0_AMBAR|nr:hypothetical protein M8C21_028883 [Ambrosia artemisiifolia]
MIRAPQIGISKSPFQLSTYFCDISCPRVITLCCDASILLDNTPTIPCEKLLGVNINSARGCDVSDMAKEEVEGIFWEIVMCTDVLELTLRAVVELVRGLASSIGKEGLHDCRLRWCTITTWAIFIT